MLSMILYGRNDAHGYNLHKRGALSLNALAEVLADPSDELIFVDYNTPDELPTFPEAIADTLTDRCKARLRILRVRPDYHRRFAGLTRLVALEPHSRNIAIRRANPDNRWILSTNTDMIFCTADQKASLSSVVGGLEDGFYHLPRFEVPEGFWERLDRKDPHAAIASMRDAGTRFHLNEIVYGSYDNLYEGPGDFQLFLKQDLHDIRGFDERMILGWHADSNMARRMKLLRGEVKSAFPQVLGYHCGHTRQATSLHGGNRTQNNSDIFVRDLTDPVAPDQADTWGAPDYPVEEVRLDRDDRYFHALSAAVKQSGPAFSEAGYNEASFNEVGFDADHVLPHLCDVLFNLPAGQKIFYFGDDLALLEGVRTFLEDAGKEPRFLITDFAGCPDVAKLDAARWADRVMSVTGALAEADLIVLQYPGAEAPTEERFEREWWNQRLLAAVVHMERKRPKDSRRRIVVVNGVHNALSSLVESSLAPSAMPFSSRLRQGFVIDEALGSAQDIQLAAEWPIYQRLGRATPFVGEDLELLHRIFNGLRQDTPPEGWQRLAPEIAAICAAPERAREIFKLTEEEAASWEGLALSSMRATIARLVEQPSAVGPRADVGNRLGSGDDWSDRDWLTLAIAYFSHNVVSLMERKRWMWERVSVLDAVRRRLPLELPGLAGAMASPRILVMAEGADLVGPILVHMGYEVTYTTTAELLAGRAEMDWKAELDVSWLRVPPALRPFDAQSGARFDAFVALKPSLFEKSFDEAEEILGAVHPLMVEGALFFCAATVQVNDKAYDGGFSFAEWKGLYDPDGPLGARGFTAVAGMDTRVPLDAAVRFAWRDDPQETVYGLSYGFVNSYNTSALLTAQWPAVLQAGNPERKVWEGEAIDAAATHIPYGSSATGAGPETPAATALLDDNLASHALRAIEAASTPVRALKENVLPHALTNAAAQRLPTGLAIGKGGWLALSLEAGGAACVTLELQGDNIALGEASPIVHGLGHVPAELEGGKVVVRHAPGLGRVSVALRFEGDARLSRVDAWTEA